MAFGCNLLSRVHLNFKILFLKFLLSKQRWYYCNNLFSIFQDFPLDSSEQMNLILRSRSDEQKNENQNLLEDFYFAQFHRNKKYCLQVASATATTSRWDYDEN